MHLLAEEVEFIHRKRDVNLEFLAGHDHPVFIGDDEEVQFQKAAVHVLELTDEQLGELIG